MKNLAVKYLMNGGESNIFNLGNGVDFTGNEVVRAAIPNGYGEGTDK